MVFTSGADTRAATAGIDGTIYRLSDGLGGVAEVWPAMGFNCYRWDLERAGRTLQILFADDGLLGPNGRSTRGGVPILFPFPNRIRDGRYQWDGREYQLPLLDSSSRNAIHGFVCRKPWRVTDHGTDGTSAWVTGEFHGSVDAPESAALWPADYRLRVTYRLRAGALRIEAEASNPDERPLPFGLGYHPYFRVPFASDDRPTEDCRVCLPAHSYWVLDQSLPTGKRQPVDAARDLNAPRAFADLTLDDVLTDLPRVTPGADGLIERATINSAGVTLRLLCTTSFREMVVFTPPHRHAFCIEPYTCATDAINLQAHGIDAGWQVLQPGESWTGVVELRID